MNGKIGDHPYTDIVHHGHDTYSPRAAALVRDIVRLADDRTCRELADLLLRDFNVHRHPDVPKLENLLTALHERVQREARERGYEVD